MSDIPKFVLYGEGDPSITEAIQPPLALRKWSDLSKQEKRTALQELVNRGWIGTGNEACLLTIERLNFEFLRRRPGERVHKMPPPSGRFGLADVERTNRRQAAVEDFQDLFVNDRSEDLVFRMLSILAACQIDHTSLNQAKNSKEPEERQKFVTHAFAEFDRLAGWLNHIFRQFAVNQTVTRNGFVPRQDETITDAIYVPTLKALADPKWATVSGALSSMFQDYREQRYSEVITKAHSAVQRFLQIAVGEEGKSGKGELAKLFKDAKDRGIIPTDRFTAPVIDAILSFLPSERATNSTAKPALKEATATDALLVMNVVVVLLQHCLQNIK